ncbi:MAG: RNA methyltransferase [Pseudomonadota bacterium]
MSSEKTDKEAKARKRRNIRARADAIKDYRCRKLIAVLENPSDMRNIGTVIRNVDALGVEKTYIVDPERRLPEDWQDMRTQKTLSKSSVSAIKWSFVKRFDTTADCLDHLRENLFVSVVTSPHIKGHNNVVLHEADYTGYKRLAVWFGNEAFGISDEAVANADACVSIPMFGMIESLNLGTTSGIVLYEITKQRRAWQRKYRRTKKQMKREIAALQEHD